MQKQRHHFANKGLSSQGYGFPVVMYGCESWTMEKAEHRRIDAFELWYWRRLLRVPWTARRSNQTILKEISPGCSLEGMMLKLKLQYFGHLMWRVDSLKKSLMMGRIGGRRIYFINIVNIPLDRKTRSKYGFLWLNCKMQENISINMYSVPTMDKAPLGYRWVYNITSKNYSIKGDTGHKLWTGAENATPKYATLA